MTLEKCFFIHLTDEETEILRNAADVLRQIENLAFSRRIVKKLLIGCENIAYSEDDICLAHGLLDDFGLGILKESEED